MTKQNLMDSAKSYLKEIFKRNYKDNEESLDRFLDVLFIYIDESVKDCQCSLKDKKE